MKFLGFVTAFVLLAPSVLAGPIIIPVRQNQTIVNVGSQGQIAGGGITDQNATLNQVNQPTQTVNVIVPENFKGNVRPVYLPSNANLGERGRTFLDRREDRRDGNNGNNGNRGWERHEGQ